MKRLFLLLSAAIFLFSSCKQDSSSGSSGDNNDELSAPYYFRCKVDGTLQNFTSTYTCSLSKIDIASAHYYTFLLQAAVNKTNAPYIQIQLTQETLFGTIPVTHTSSSASLNCIYAPNVSNLSGEAYSGGSTMGNPTTFQLIVTTLDNTTIKGTFAGTVSKGEGSAATNKSITDGEFYMPLKRE